MWAWVAIIGGALLAYYYWKNKTTATQPATGTSASDVPQFVNQTYVNTSAPSAPGTGTGQVSVPNVVGMTDTAGDAAITAAGLKVKDVNEKKGGSGGSTKITAQSPAGGTMVAQGSTVEITLGAPVGTKPKKPAPKKKPGTKPKKPEPKGDK